MAERVTVPDMMNAREARAQAQRTLLARYPGAAVVCLCMNIAGPVKRTENIERAFAWGAVQVKAVLAPYEIYNIGNSTNPSTRSIINVAT